MNDMGGMTPEEVAELVAYAEAQGTDVSRAGMTAGRFPFPHRDNPMLAFLMRRAAGIADAEGPRAAMAWLAVHAWMEGALEGVARVTTS